MASSLNSVGCVKVWKHSFLTIYWMTLFLFAVSEQVGLAPSELIGAPIFGITPPLGCGNNIFNCTEVETAWEE